jgi:hypothetical protein
VRKKVLTGAAIGVAVPAAVAVARKLSGSDESKQEDGGSGIEKAGTSTARKTTGRTKEQLYREAKRLNVEGRSKMSKAELERAVQRARS